MKKGRKFSKIFFIFFFIFILFRYNYIINESVISAMELFLNKVFPSLFIMFILNDLIINLNILEPLIKLINPLFNKVYATYGFASEAFLLSIFSGTPSSAFILKEMLQKNLITLNDANKLISFTFFSNPLFFYNILSLSFNKFITYKIILIHYLTNLLIGILFRHNISNPTTLNETSFNVSKNLLSILPNAINKSINTLLMILGTITFYMIVSNLIIHLINFSPLLSVLIKGLLEITQSLNILNTLNYSSLIKEVIALSVISFGGLSIHTQVLNLISDTSISYKNFFLGRIYHVLISTSAYLFLTIFLIG